MADRPDMPLDLPLDMPELVAYLGPALAMRDAIETSLYPERPIHLVLPFERWTDLKEILGMPVIHANVDAPMVAVLCPKSA